MVLRGEMRRRPERAKTLLHNFTLPNLKWGSQRHLKCSRIGSGGGSGDHRLRRRSPPPLKLHASSVSIQPFEGIEEFRVKIMSDLKTVRDKITQSMFRQEEEEQGSPVKPWNLRKRRAEEPVTIEERIVNLSPPSRVAEAERPEFSVKLTKKEIEEDFMAVLGHRPPRRPKKRPRNVQKKLDRLHPGFYLNEVTLDAYKVEEAKR